MSMFTLKLYRYKSPNDTTQKMHICIPVAKVVVMDIGKQALELQAIQENGDYHTYYVGIPEQGMESFGRDDLHLGTTDQSWWGWGLLENWEGNTSEHYRPASYG